MRSQLSVSLKQKLSTLSRSPSAPSLSISPTTAKAKLRSVIPTSWKRHGGEGLNSQEYGRERLQEVISRLIFQAGVDFETRPMVVIAASALPDPDEVSYDLLLTRILAYLDLYVESDYTLVFLAAGGRYAPSWNWVWKVYRSQLSRKYRKNLKKLYIVHPSFFSKMLFSLAGAIISPKFFQKIQYCNTLSDLACHVPLTQIDIPPAVYQENLKHEAGITLPIKPLTSHFGVPLEELMGIHGEKGDVPRVVRDCVIYLRKSGMEQIGLFRRSPLSTTLNQVKAAYDRGHPINLETYNEPHLAAVLLKKFFRDLPTPIFPEECYSIIRRCPPPNHQDGDLACIAYIRESILPALNGYCAVFVLSYVLNLLHEVSLRADVNKMDAHNLAIVFTPNLLKSTNPMRDAQMCAIPEGPALFLGDQGNSVSRVAGHTTVGSIIKCCIQHYYEIFDETPDRSEAKALSTDTSGARPVSADGDSDGDSDDTMLVMHVGSLQGASSSSPRAPPSAWTAWTSQPNFTSGAGLSYLNTTELPQSPSSTSGLAARSFATGDASGAFPSIRKSRSTISIEKGSGPVAAVGRRKGSIRVHSGGTLGKSVGSAVEAWGVTASGFFSPPGTTPARGNGDTAR
ncbi:hypothetical protein BU17DRAFT_43851 [Hysterangium stoloniferum]|nr:hypothetical protein BU17DRAFT_43851 [Hysterangium stoloniferum]